MWSFDSFDNFLCINQGSCRFILVPCHRPFIHFSPFFIGLFFMVNFPQFVWTQTFEPSISIGLSIYSITINCFESMTPIRICCTVRIDLRSSLKSNERTSVLCVYGRPNLSQSHLSLSSLKRDAFKDGRRGFKRAFNCRPGCYAVFSAAERICAQCCQGRRIPSAEEDITCLRGHSGVKERRRLGTWCNVRHDVRTSWNVWLKKGFNQVSNHIMI